MKKLFAFILGILFLASAAYIPVQAAPKSTGISISITKDVLDSSDSTTFSVRVYKDNALFKEGTISEGKPLLLSNLKTGTYRVEELAKEGYENVSITTRCRSQLREPTHSQYSTKRLQHLLQLPSTILHLEIQ